MKPRIYFLDNLRAFLIFLVIVMHTGIVYTSFLDSVWIVSDPVKNESLGLVIMYLDIFVMFAMFFISGYFIPASVKFKSTWGFLKSKFNRIMLPWIVAVLTLIPAYKAIFLYSRDLPQEEWYTYFHIFDRAGGNLGFFADNPTQGWLWFLPVLFLFQAIYLVLAKANVLKIKISLRTSVILIFVIGVIYSMTISKFGLRGWFDIPILHFQRERLLIYFLVFLLGSLCNMLNVFESKTKNKRLFILSNVVLTLSLGIFTVVALNFLFNMIEPERNIYIISGTVDGTLYYSSLLLAMFSFLYILIYVFQFRINYTNRIMGELSKNSYSVYIIHTVVIGLIALAILNIYMPALIKFLLVTVLAFIISNLLVSGYRVVFQKMLSGSFLSKAIVPAVILITVVVYAKQGASSPPDVGIHTAVIQGNLEAIRQHIQAGSDLDQAEPAGGSSPLITAAVFGKTEIALALIEAGADVNFKNHEGSTPLHSAAFFCRTEIVKALLANGASKNIRNNAGSTALDSVLPPFEIVKAYYDYFQNTLGPLGLELNYDEITRIRPDIAELLQKNISE